MREVRLWAAAAAAPAVAAGFSLLAGLRRRRSLHPAGAGYRGRFVVDDDHPDRQGVPLVQPGTAATAVLRLSRAAGLPEPLPDALGVAVKLPDVYGPGADQDLLLTSSIDRQLGLSPAELLVLLRADLGHGRPAGRAGVGAAWLP